MRLAAYAGASTVLATGVILKAFHERPNFYSASVYLSQSSACRMILLNLLLLMTYGVVRGMQKVIYGPLRAIEREQLWDKAWYAVTETALAMTTFRDEVGTWFFVMFVALLAGKVWQWISEARVEALEQQPPANPRLFHARLISSLVISDAFDLLMLRYCVNTLLEQPRPGMMVMFAFEFAVLAISSTSTAAKYVLSLVEGAIVKRQMKARIAERREELRLDRAQAASPASDGADGALTSGPATQPEEEEIDEAEIDVPGWQDKGRWSLFLDLLTDFLKLLVYMCFFSILLMFHGIPIHIIRDVFITTRSFVKRIADFFKYRNATRDMNARYPDATAEELGRDGTCIICREEMQPWQPHPHDPGQRRPTRTVVDERQRPKRLPCGHVLHFGCLRSWLERQQVCPTCRSSVLAPPTNHNNNAANRGETAQPGHDAGQVAGQQAGNQPGGQNGRQQPQRNGARARTFQLGSWRFTLAAGNEQQVQDLLRGQRDNNTRGAQAVTDVIDAINSTNSSQDQLSRIERQLMRDINNINATSEQLGLVRTLQGELARLRMAQNNPAAAEAAIPPAIIPPLIPPFPHGLPSQTGFRPTPTTSHMGFSAPFLTPPQQSVFTSSSSSSNVLGPGHPDLPPGLSLPEGWNLLPLQRATTHQQAGSGRSQITVPPDAVLLQTSMSNYNRAANTTAPTLTGTSSPHHPFSSAQQAQQVDRTLSGIQAMPTTERASEGAHTVDSPSVTLDDGPISGLPNWAATGPATISTGQGHFQTGNDVGSSHDTMTDWASTAPATSSTSSEHLDSVSNEASERLPNWARTAPAASSMGSAQIDQEGGEINGVVDADVSNVDKKGKRRAATVEDADDVDVT